jgi:hypothetical protein
VAGTSDRAESRDHLLVDEENQGKDWQEPEKSQRVVLTGLREQRQTAGVVARHDQTRADDRCEGRKAASERDARAGVERLDATEGTFDVALMRTVEQRPALRRRAEHPLDNRTARL